MNILQDVSAATGSPAIGLHTFTSLGLSFLFGLAILMVYVLSNRHKKLDDSLTEVIPLLTVLMSVMMHIDNSVQAVTFFGIFGVLSIVRFRSALTEQKGITFILFAVIIGILVGTRQYYLSITAFAILSIMVLTVPRLLPARQFFLIRCKFTQDHLAKKAAVETFIQSSGLRYKIVGTRGESASRANGKSKAPMIELEFEVRRPRSADLVELYTRFNEFAAAEQLNIQILEHT
ncbi:DUF4956 domain-containing protein [Spirochaeta africana]|uniref:DUF4956 domain-containing protein n=1 Tax=Spirochaeta africana (strain ATCC 700263 / DSM 8902 / Z-7692) TaxID=889378 RepID=H9UF89_SPIAZ|nr:DUF4956 domain-containing protein [Spirochaeta africana]AFG36182.1 hypothetical protein Spiaf_0073 [Spirochaeta africana DSM 8902]